MKFFEFNNNVLTISEKGIRYIEKIMAVSLKKNVSYDNLSAFSSGMENSLNQLSQFIENNNNVLADTKIKSTKLKNRGKSDTCLQFTGNILLEDYKDLKEQICNVIKLLNMVVDTDPKGKALSKTIEENNKIVYKHTLARGALVTLRNSIFAFNKKWRDKKSPLNLYKKPLKLPGNMSIKEFEVKHITYKKNDIDFAEYKFDGEDFEEKSPFFEEKSREVKQQNNKMITNRKWQAMKCDNYGCGLHNNNLHINDENTELLQQAWAKSLLVGMPVHLCGVVNEDTGEITLAPYKNRYGVSMIKSKHKFLNKNEKYRVMRPDSKGIEKAPKEDQRFLADMVLDLRGSNKAYIPAHIRLALIAEGKDPSDPKTQAWKLKDAVKYRGFSIRFTPSYDKDGPYVLRSFVGRSYSLQGLVESYVKHQGENLHYNYEEIVLLCSMNVSVGSLNFEVIPKIVETIDNALISPSPLNLLKQKNKSIKRKQFQSKYKSLNSRDRNTLFKPKDKKPPKQRIPSLPQSLIEEIVSDMVEAEEQSNKSESKKKFNS